MLLGPIVPKWMKIRICYLACDDKSKAKGNLVISWECDTKAAALARESALRLCLHPWAGEGPQSHEQVAESLRLLRH
jgi:hypothetical protein